LIDAEPGHCWGLCRGSSYRRSARQPDGQIRRTSVDVAPSARLGRLTMAAREKRFRQMIQRDLGRPVPLAKRFLFVSRQISGFLSTVPAHQEGRIAIVTDVGLGMRWTPQRQAQSLRGRMTLPRTAKSCGPGAPTQALRSQRRFPRLASDGGNPAWSPGRSRISRKTIAQGRPDDPARTCGSAACFFVARGPWVQQAPGLPCALRSFEGRSLSTTRTLSCRENAGSCR
jgi:hypothetical protein